MTEQISETYRFPKALSAALKRTIITGVEVSHVIGLSDLLNRLKETPNYRKSGENLPKGSQHLFPNFVDDAKNILDSFGGEAHRIGQELFDRKLIGKEKDFDIYLNYNAYDFYRDTNLSISLVDPESKREVAILAFFILPDKTIEIFQLQGRKKYGIGEDEFSLLIKATKSFLKYLGFQRIRIIRSEKLYLTKVPTHLPERIKTEDEYSQWLDQHRHRMKLTYDVNPTRKWGFHKPKDPEIAKSYSGEMDL